MTYLSNDSKSYKCSFHFHLSEEHGGHALPLSLEKILYTISYILMVSGSKSICFSSEKICGYQKFSFSFFVILRGQHFELIFPGTPALQNDSVNKELAPKESSHLESYYLLSVQHMLAAWSLSGGKEHLTLTLSISLIGFLFFFLIPHSCFFPSTP